MTTLNLEPTHGDLILPGDFLYDGPHRGTVLERKVPAVGESAKYLHLVIDGDGTPYRVALIRDDYYQVHRRPL